MKLGVLLLSGVSGAGKTTLLKELRKIDNRFEPVYGYTDRPLRKDDLTRKYAATEEIERLRNEKECLLYNKVYGNTYLVLMEDFTRISSLGKIPVYDFPVDKLHVAKEKFGESLYSVYVRPESISVLKNRLQNEKRDHPGRFEHAIKEIERVKNGDYNGLIDLLVINRENSIRESADEIYNSFVKYYNNMEEKTLKLKHDMYRKVRGGTAVTLDINCSKCSDRVLVYQKDGKGYLHRLYLNRILYPPNLEKLQYSNEINTKNDLDPLKCNKCGNIIGVPMLHSEGRLAFRLVGGSYSKTRTKDFKIKN